MRRVFFGFLTLAFFVSAFAIHDSTANATWNQNRIIDDNVFNSSSSMNSSEIDLFLNSKANSCISTNSGFEARIPTGYSPSGGFTYGNFGTAGQVITAAAQAYNINPRVLLVTLEKEQSLVTGRNSPTYCYGTEHKYTAAVGYGCPDSGGSYSYTGVSLYKRSGVEHTESGSTCVNSSSKAGFTQQLIRAAWVLKYSQQRALGNIDWAIVNGSWDNSDDLIGCYSGPMTQGTWKVCPGGSASYYDGYRTIDSTAVQMTTGATASLYRYTPHFHGNQLFVSIWEGWWGDTLLGVFGWTPQSLIIMNAAKTEQVDRNNLQPGERYVVVITARNTNSATWYRNGANPTFLATSSPTSRNSNLCNGDWDACNRPARLTEETVIPGDIGTFEFAFNAPMQAGRYSERFKPVAEMLSWFNDSYPGDVLEFTVASPGTFNWQSLGYGIEDKSGESADPGRLNPGELYDVTLTAKNTGTATWKNSGPMPVTLATSGPTGRTSRFCRPSWPKCQRPALLTESTVAPGQTGHFSFEIEAPRAIGQFRERFKPVAEMYTWFNDDHYDELGIWTVAGTYTWIVHEYYVVRDQSNQVVNPQQLQSGQTYTVTLAAKNTGTATWKNNGPIPIHLAASSPTSRVSALCHGSWIGCNRPTGLIESTVAPGQAGTFTFTFQAPTVSSPTVYREWFKPVAELFTWFNDAPFNELNVRVLP